MSRAGVANLRTIEFIREYDAMLLKYPDPMETLFRLLKSRKQNIKLQAATQLLQYRYPKLAAVKLDGEGPSQMSLGWDEDPDVIEGKPANDVIEQIQQLHDQGA